MSVKQMNAIFGPNVETWDEDEQERLEHLEEYVRIWEIFLHCNWVFFLDRRTN